MLKVLEDVSAEINIAYSVKKQSLQYYQIVDILCYIQLNFITWKEY